MTTRVTFKVETEVNGELAGPVFIYDVEAYEADPVIAAHEGPGMPYGYQPQGRTSLGWMTRRQALEAAAGAGVELDEGAVAHG